eukprot:jgi/Tetstr1/420444/TSEL_011557.t1
MSSLDRAPGLLRGLSRVLSRQAGEAGAREVSAGVRSDQPGDGAGDEGGGEGRAEAEAEPSLLGALWSTGAWRILPFLVLSILGFAVLIPVLPVIITEFFAMRRTPDGAPVHCASFRPHEEPMACQNAHSDSVTASSITSFVSMTIVSFFLTPYMGRWSDQYGRRPFLIIAGLFGVLPLVVFMLAFYRIIGLIWWYPALIGAHGVDKISLSVAYTADLMPPSLRAPTIGFVTASLAGAMLVGPLISAHLDIVGITWLCVALGALTVAWAAFGIRESTTAESRASAQAEAAAVRAAASARGVGSLLSSFTSTWAIVMRSRLFLTLTVVMMMVGIVQEGLQDLIMQYLQIKVGFGVADNSAVLIVVGVGGLVSQTLLLRPLLAALGEKWVLVVALVAQAAQQVMLAFVATRNEVWVALSVGVLGMMSFPTLSGIKSRHSEEHEQGAVQGALFGAKSLAQGTGPLIFAPLFALFTRDDSPLPYMPGAPFLMGAALMFLSVILAATMPSCGTRLPKDSEQPDVEQSLGEEDDPTVPLLVNQPPKGESGGGQPEVFGPAGSPSAAPSPASCVAPDTPALTPQRPAMQATREGGDGAGRALFRAEGP